MTNKIRELREQHHLTLRELAEKLNMSFSNIATLERGDSQLREDTTKIFCNFFNVSADYLLGLSDIRNPEIDTKPDKISFALHGYEEDLTDDDKDMILNLAKRLAENNKK